MAEMSYAEMEFGKNGYLKYENEDIIVYYVPYKVGDMRHKDITFCKQTGKIICYQGTNYGPDAFILEPSILEALFVQSKEIEKRYGKLQGKTKKV